MNTLRFARAGAAIVLVTGLASPAMAGLGAKPVTLPNYIVTVTLSPELDAKFKDADEKIHIAVEYFGKVVKADDGDSRGELKLGAEEADIQGNSAAEFGKITMKSADLEKVFGRAPTVRITVTTTAKSLLGNGGVECSGYTGSISETAGKRIPVTCKSGDGSAPATTAAAAKPKK